MIDEERSNSYEQVDQSFWNAPTAIGVVVFINKNAEEVLVDMGVSIQTFPFQQGIEYGHTVEVDTETNQILRTISEKPITTRTAMDLVAPFAPIKVDDSMTYEDFGGLPDVVDQVRKLIETPLKHADEIKEINARPVKGVLFSGAPGTGKTLLARIVAKESGVPFFTVSASDLVSKWLGESGGLTRRLFETAKSEKQAIVFIDEIDSIAGIRSENSHEETRRMLTELLTQMDGFTPDSNIIVIAATNRPQDLDPALLRAGRFDWEVYFRMPDEKDRLAILIAGKRSIKTHGDLELPLIAAQTEGWSAAELSSLWTAASHFTARDNRKAINAHDLRRGVAQIAQRQEIMYRRGHNQRGENV